MASPSIPSLIGELEAIWDEIGATQCERDKTRLQLQQECLDIYRKKVADLRQELADRQALITTRESGTLRDQLSAVKPVLEEKTVKELCATQAQSPKISGEIAGNGDSNNDGDLGVQEPELQEPHQEKDLRLQKVNDYVSTIHDLSVLMSIDFSGVHPRWSGQSSAAHSRSISNNTLAGLTAFASFLKQEKQQRLIKLQDLGSKLVDLWDLLGTAADEREEFLSVTTLLSCSDDDQLSRQGSLSAHVIQQTEAEVERLSVLRASKMKELVFEMQTELEEICRGIHEHVNSHAIRRDLIIRIDSGANLLELISSIGDQIAQAKDRAKSKKHILDDVAALEFAISEQFLPADKIESMIENLTAKVRAWEIDKGISFMYEEEALLSWLTKIVKPKPLGGKRDIHAEYFNELADRAFAKTIAKREFKGLDKSESSSEETSTSSEETSTD